jgi:hypothetical protein
MKLFGYLTSATEAPEPSDLSEVTLQASSEELREIAGFLLQAANSIDRMGKSYDHIHLSDALPQFENSPAFVIARG